MPDGRNRDEGTDLDLTWRGGAEWNPSPGHFVEFGAQARSLAATRINRLFRQTTTTTLLNADVDTWSAAGWSQYRWTPSARFSITPGVRVERWDLTGSTKASPWLLSDFEVRPGTRAAIRSRRAVPGADASISRCSCSRAPSWCPERSATIEAGVEQRIGATLRVSGSVYHRRDTDLLRFDDAEVRVVNNRVVLPQASNWQNALEGTANGIELKVERRSANGFNGWVSYAWNKAELDDPRGAGQPDAHFYADYDQRHTVNTYVAYRLSGRTSLSARFRYGSNFPIRGYVGSNAAGFVLTDQRNGLRLPEYARLDLRADRTFTYRKSRLTVFLEVVNATNRDNYRPSGAGVNINTRRIFEPYETTFPLLPVGGILIEF